MALSSAFAIAAARRETKQGGEKWKPALKSELTEEPQFY